MLPVLRLLLIASSVLVIFSLARYTILHLYPFFIALALALAMNPAVSLLERKLNMSRTLAILFTLLGVLAIFFSIVIYAIVEIAQGTAIIADKLPGQIELLAEAIRQLTNDLLGEPYVQVREIFHSLGGAEQALVHYQFNGLIRNAAEALQHLLWQLPQWLLIIPGSLATLLLSILAAFFIANDWPRLVNFSRKKTPETVKIRLGLLKSELKKTVGNYMKAQLILLAATGVIVLIGLLILRIEHALTISLAVLAVDLLPYAGTGLVFIPWIIYVFLSGQYDLAIGLSLLYMVIIIFRQLAEPKLLSSSIGIHPLLMLIALFAGLQLWGPAGLFATPILLVLINGLRASGLLHDAWQYIQHGKV